MPQNYAPHIRANKQTDEPMERHHNPLWRKMIY
jgi:hypothetical protein